MDFLVLDERFTPSTMPTDPGTSPAVEQCRWDVELGLPANCLAASPRMRIEEHGIQLPTGIRKAQLVRIYEDATAVRMRPPPSHPQISTGSLPEHDSSTNLLALTFSLGTSISSTEPLTDVVRALQNSVSDNTDTGDYRRTTPL